MELSSNRQNVKRIKVFLSPLCTWICSLRSVIQKKMEREYFGIRLTLNAFFQCVFCAFQFFYITIQTAVDYLLKNLTSWSSIGKSTNENSLLCQRNHHWQVFLHVQRQRIPIKLINGIANIFKPLRDLITEMAVQIKRNQNQQHYNKSLKTARHMTGSD